MGVDDGALAAWADFPVATEPRPFVVVEGYVRVCPSGFTGGDAKLAFLNGAIESGVELPDGVFELVAPHSEDLVGGSDRKITITALGRIEALFRTDRGPQLFPAYALDCDGTHEPVLVLDPATPVWWPKRATPESTARGSATIEADRLTLHVLAHGGLRTEFLDCRLTETETAVLAGPRTRERDAGGRAVRGTGVGRPVSGRLAQPLGGRALINTDGLPITVLPA